MQWEDNMKIIEILEGTRCWKGYEKKGTKMMFGKRVNNCVKKEGLEEESDRLVVTMDNGKTFDITDFKGANDLEKSNSFLDVVKKIYGKNNTPVPNYKVNRGANQINTSTSTGRSNPYYKDPRLKDLDDFANRARQATKESASATATASGNIATVNAPVQARQKLKRDKNGLPVAPQAKNPDGTAKNALDVKSNIMGTPMARR